jgi:hypothetical protein
MADLLIERHPYDEVGNLDVGSIFGSIAKVAKGAVKAVGKGVKAVGNVAQAGAHAVGQGTALLGKIPVVGEGLKSLSNMTIGAPFAMAEKVLSGQRLDKVALNTIKEQVKAVKGVAPYAQTVLSFVPGVGQGMAGAIGASMALASGQPITQALAEGVKGALPGGPLAKAAFSAAQGVMQGKPVDKLLIAALPISDQQKALVAAGLNTAKSLAHGERVDATLLNNALAALPPDVKKAVTVGMAIGHGQVLQAVKTASTMAQPKMVKDVFGKIANVVPAPLRRAPVQILSPDISRAMTAMRKNPALAFASPTALAKNIGISSGAAQRARQMGKFGLKWAPLSTNASRLVMRHSPFSNLRHLTDTRGLSPDGLIYVVEPGDYPGKIAQKLTGAAKNWPQLIAANPTKPTKTSAIGKEFKTLFAGEKLIVPKAWQKAAPAPALPTPGAVVTPTVQTPAPVVPEVVVVDPQRANVASILQAKGLLVTWSKSDGKKVAGFEDYGTKPEDLSTGFGERDQFMLASFEGWSNRVRGTNLPTDGLLTDSALGALQRWAESRVEGPTPTLDTTPAATLPTSPGIMPNAVPSLPSIPNPVPNVVPTPGVPQPIVDLPVMTIEEATPPKPKDDFTLAIAGAAAGGLLAGVVGAAVGGAGGFLIESMSKKTA